MRNKELNDSKVNYKLLCVLACPTIQMGDKYLITIFATLRLGEK